MKYAMEGWRKLNIEKLLDVHPSPNVLMVVTVIMKRARQVDSTSAERNA